MSTPERETAKIIRGVPDEEEPTIRVVIFLTLSKAQLLDRMKYLMKVDKSEVVERAIDDAIKSGKLRR